MQNSEDLLNIVRDELRRCIGLDADRGLNAERATVLEYTQGRMPDVPTLKNRSGAVTTDVRDAIETALPDLIEVLTSENVVQFPATGADDEYQAKVETEYCRTVFFDDNRGFLALYSAIKDALTLRLGALKIWSQRETTREEQDVSGAPAGSASMAEASGFEIENFKAGDDGLESFTISRTTGRGKVFVVAWPIEDLGYSSDASDIGEATYVVARERVRAFELIARGYDAEVVSHLTPYNVGSEEMELARDVSGTTDLHARLGGNGLHHTVEVLEHYIRVLDDDQIVIKRLITNFDATVLLDEEEVDAIPFAVGTPYLMPHRIMGLSVADMLMDIQRIKTALLRMALDSGYFALNQRIVVSDDGKNESTIGDLLDNTPGAPIRVRSLNAVQALGSSGLSFDVFGAMESVTSMGENRTGIIRAAQGLNSDALHETAQGQQVMHAAAQKRIRLIARVLAECLIAPAFKLLHAACRRVIQEPVTKKISATWRDDIVPAKWRERGDITIDVGIGSGGRAEDIAYATRILELQEKLVQAGFGGTMVDPTNVFNAVSRLVTAMGVKSVETLFTDPAKAKAPPDKPDGEDAEMAKAQAELQIEREKMAGQMQIEREKMQAEMNLARERMQAEAELERDRMVFQAQSQAALTGTVRLPANRPGGDLSA